MLSPGFENGDGGGVRQVETALASLHGQAQTLIGGEFGKYFGRQSTRFPAKNKDIILAQRHREQAVAALGRHG